MPGAPPPSGGTPTGARRPRLPLAAALLTGLWGAGVVFVTQLSTHRGDVPPVCHLRRLSGVPCPTCGSTRATLALAKGDLLGAIAWNPWLIAVYFMFGVSLAARLTRQPRYNLIARLLARPRVAVVLLLSTLALNWIYVLATQR